MGNEAADADGRSSAEEACRRSSSASSPADGSSRSGVRGSAGSARLSGGSGGADGEHESTRTSSEPTRSPKASDERATFSLHALYRENRLATAVKGACFWTAIVLPFLYVPLLIAGIESRSEGLALFVLLALNALSLLVGHSYRT